MEHRLSRQWSHVEYRPVAFFDVPLTGDLRRYQVAMTDEFCIFRLRFLESHDVPSRNNQHVRRRLRMDILKRVHLRVFKDFLVRQFAAHNAAEKTVSHLDSPLG